MVKAPQEVIDRINSGEDSEYDNSPVDEGDYLCRAIEAKEYEPAAGKEFGGVNITWEIMQPREFRGRRLWTRLSWSPKAAWKIREFWDAVGYDYDSDFDEAVEQREQAILEVEQAIIPYGKRKGEVGNNVLRVLEATADAVAGLPA